MQTVDDEVAWLRRYAAILEIRHRGILTFRWDIAPPARDVRIPRPAAPAAARERVHHGALPPARGRRGLGARRGRWRPADLYHRGQRPGACHARAARTARAGSSSSRGGSRFEYVGAAAFRLEADGMRTRAIVELPVEAP